MRPPHLDGPTGTRCPCCGARDWSAAAPGWRHCGHCDIELSPDERPGPAAVHDALGGKAGSHRWRGTRRTLRIAATARGLWLAGDWRQQHAATGGAGEAPRPLRTFGRHGVSLVVLSRPGDPALDPLLARYAPRFHDTVVVLDTATSPPRRDTAALSVVARPLRGDFAAQRNAGSRRARGRWVFHLDTDEVLPGAFCAALPHLAAAAEQSGYLVVGFPRCTLVDGRLSDLYPDIQHRLLRRDVAFVGRVHERPAPCDAGDRSIVSHHGAIGHVMARDRVRARSAGYDRLGQDRARRADDAALLRPYAP